jgi:dTDP-4-amino-4,6-dideoxygalactose transaminase
MFPEGPPQWPPTDAEIREALESAWLDGSWGAYHGTHVERLEEELASLHAVKHAYCCSSGTLAVELALRGLRVGAGDEVLLSAYDFPGNFRAIEAIGAVPVLVDVAPGTWQLDLNRLSELKGTSAKAIVVSHLHGCLAPLPEICEWAGEGGIPVVEDACQAHGATLRGRMAGAWGDVGVLSFGGSKLMTAGRGGALLTNDPTVHQRVKIHCEQGNHAYPLSQLQAAVLLPQLQALPERNQQRARAVTRLRRAVNEVAFLQSVETEGQFLSPSYYKIGWWYRPQAQASFDTDAFIAAAQAEGIAIGRGFMSFAQRSAKRCRKAGNMENARQAGEKAVLLHHPVLLSDDVMLDNLGKAVERIAHYLQQIYPEENAVCRLD